MTTTEPPDTTVLERLEALLAGVRSLSEQIIGTPLAIPSTGLIPDVVDGALIETAWGNAVAGTGGRVLQRFDNWAQLKAQWTAPVDGVQGVTLDDGRVYVRRAGRWYWQGIVFPGSTPGTITTDANAIFNLLPTTPGVNLDVITGGILELGYAADMTAYGWSTSRYNAGVLSARLFKTSATGGGTVALAVNTSVSTASAFVSGYRN
jgi:hypothetical protein